MTRTYPIFGGGIANENFVAENRKLFCVIMPLNPVPAALCLGTIQKYPASFLAGFL